MLRKKATIVGTAGADVVVVHPSRRKNVVVTLGGDDRVVGLRPGDLACTGDGDDRVLRNHGWGAFVDTGDGDDIVRTKNASRIRVGAGTTACTSTAQPVRVVLGPGTTASSSPLPARGAGR